MVTIKLAYQASPEDSFLIQRYQDQYAICLRTVYNVIFEDNKAGQMLSKFEYLKAGSICMSKLNKLNHIELINSWVYKLSNSRSLSTSQSRPRP